MTIDAALAALEATSLATRIRESLYLFPFLESTHVVGLATVFGGATILDLRLLGIAGTRRPAHRIAADVLPWTLAGFLVAAATGLLMFTTNAGVYYHNTFFRVKMALLFLAALNAGLFEATARRSIDRWDNDRKAPRSGRVVAIASLVLWIAIIFMGRWIGFTTTRATAPSEVPANIEDLLPK
jgi:uncharacterized membrane protein